MLPSVRRLALTLSILVLILALTIGCGSSESAENTARSSSEATTTTPVASPPPTTTKAAKKAKKPKKHKAGGWSEAVVPPYDVSKADVYRQTRDICEVFTPKQVAAEYHSEPDAVSAALKYAKVSYQPALQQPAFEGCLAGFESDG